MDKNTKLIVRQGVGYDHIDTDGGETVAYDLEADNARRIVAAVNACAGIETNVLEKLGFGTALKIPKNIRIIEQQRDRAERALRAAGFTYAEGAEEWRPPLGPSASPLLYKIDKLQSQRDQLLAALEGFDKAMEEASDWPDTSSDRAALLHAVYSARRAIAAVKGA